MFSKKDLFWAVRQYPPDQWSEAGAAGLIDALTVALLKQPRVAQVLEESNGSRWPNLVVTLYVGATGREVWPQKVTVCHQGGGLFHTRGCDFDRVEEVAQFLTAIFAEMGG